MEALAIVISLSAFVIACLQWAISDQRIRIELFQNRIRIYQAAQDAINQCLTSEGKSEQAIRDLLLATSEARWMFDKETYEFLDDRVLADCVIFKETQSRIASGDLSEPREALFERVERLQPALLKHLKQLPDICGPLLSIERRSLPDTIILWRDGVHSFWRRWFRLDEG